jgi:hypothetical protein
MYTQRTQGHGQNLSAGGAGTGSNAQATWTRSARQFTGHDVNHERLWVVEKLISGRSDFDLHWLALALAALR